MNVILPSTEAEKLGDLLGEYRCDTTFRKLLFPAESLLFGLVFGIATVLFAAQAPLALSVGLLLGSLVCAGLGVYMAARYIVEGNWRVRAFSKGMLLTRKGKDKVVRWEEITAVRQRDIITFEIGDEGGGIPVGTFRIYTIQMQGGEKHTFSGFKVDQLGELLFRQWNQRTTLSTKGIK